MLELNQKQRSDLADKLADTGNVAAAALVFGQAVGGQTYSVGLALGGTAVWAGLLVCSLLLGRNREK